MIKLQLVIDAHEMNLIKEDLVKLKVGLNNKKIEHKFIPLEQLHIPLLMIGEKKENEVEDLASKIESVASSFTTFDLKLQGVWAYPEQVEARLLYIGVQNSIELRSFQQEFSEVIFNNSRPDFKPNLPLVRLKNHRNVKDSLSPYKTKDFGKLNVCRVMLYQITSGGAFMTYKMIQSFDLKSN